ncbi:insoluble matrix shell protein 4-like isoform X2 [Tenebrio molitor]|uniref:insoluble matrix shell protein 4-like isoform X2 n=1 Tax=Tenebrio molitor TaxID=7067 RepID=UPI003624732E
MNIDILCFLFFLQILPGLIQPLENNGNKLGDVMKNHTKSVYNSTKNQSEEENLLKQEAHKLLSECGVETSDNNYDDNDSYNNRRGSNKPRRGNNYDGFGGNNNNRKNSNRRYNNRDNSNENDGYNNRYGNRNRGNRYSGYGSDNDDDSNDDNNRYGNRRNNGNSNNRNNRYKNENYSDEEESNESNQSGSKNNNSGMKRFNRTGSNNGYRYGSTNNGNSNGYNIGYTNGYGGSDCKDENRGYYDGNGRNQWGNSDGGELSRCHKLGSCGVSGNYGYDSRNGYGFGNVGNMRRGVSGPGYTRNFDINLRAKRSNNDDDDSQCVSQCVFGYLEVLDDNRVPSETLVIKWLQDHLSNDMKRIRALREARRCFGRLSTSDTDDGCEFSQSLSKCLNLELE